MSNLTVNNNTYAYPDPGSEPGWGKEATGWAEDVTEVLDSVAGSGTINETQSTINNIATNEDVAGFVFNPALVEGAEVSYKIFRKTDSVEYSEKGTFSINYKPGAAEKWFITRAITAGDDALVSFDITIDGQVQYTTTAISGSNYQGYIRFKTTSILRV
jgi:hypothetical protein